ncbi:sialate O-acetylesterase [Daejeonella sp.]|uniref:sialate O-acetylesterase n=1 Tax=Daejeonella sp. TaxID=2805397 RepID=UPI0025C0EBA1|nr:sialate O-acetylesterase [Daejeonella sp.]
MNLKQTKTTLLLILLLIPFLGFAQVKLAKIFSNNMVLQQNEPIRIWGKGTPGETILVDFANEKQSFKVNQDSSWLVSFKSQKFNTKGQSLKVQSTGQKIELQNILIGDVWLCIGQSNMEWPMMREMHYKSEIKESNQANLRFYNPSYAGKNTYNIPFSDSIIKKLNPHDFYQGEWQISDSNTFKAMSAVGYYFGKRINQETGIPIGLINISIGGAPLETFISLNALKNDPQFADKTKGNWLENKSLPEWTKERGRQNTTGKKNIPSDEIGPNHPFKTGFAFQSGIEPIINMPIKGILNYQGESNAQEIERVNEYATLSALMVKNYRELWKNPKMPYYFVQLSSIDTLQYKGHLWPQFRDEQRKTLQMIPNSGMAVSSDIGAKNDVHPTNKKDVGARLAQWALAKTYGKKIIHAGPMPLNAKYKNGSLIITFENPGAFLSTSDDQSPRGFSIDGKNEIDAKILKNRVIIPLSEKPKHVFYAWKPFTDANLINSEKLPASTFKLKIQ